MLVSRPLCNTLIKHPLGELAQLLGTYLKIGCDIISLSLFLWRIAARIGLPFLLELISDSLSADGLIADCILTLLPRQIVHARAVKEIHELAEAHFQECEVMVITRLHENLYRRACEVANQDINSQGSVPGILTITDERPRPLPVGPVISIITNQAERLLKGFGQRYSTVDDEEHQVASTRLRALLKNMGLKNRLSCPFEDHIVAELRPEEMLVTQRLMRTIAALRVCWMDVQGQTLTPQERMCTVDDYAVATRHLNSIQAPHFLKSLSC